ncbi:MAG: MmgE/PrpD family protein [Candidatus Helarchaeota archaeon]
MMTKSEKMAEWILSISYEKIPQNVIQIAKQQLLGMLGACFAGSTTIGGKILLETIKGYESKPDASILPSEARLSLRSMGF